MSEPLLVVDGIRKRLAAQEVLCGISFSLQPGTIVGFVGPNGAGKTTTMKVIAGLLRPDAGEVRLGGFRLRDQPREFLRQLGVLIESPGTYPGLTAYQHLAYLARARDCFSDRLVKQTLQSVGLSADSSKPVRQFSLGMKQRLGIAMALIHSPKLLVLDEPMNGLDPAGMVALRDFLRTLACAQGVSIFISSHLLAEVEKVSDQVLFLRAGRLVRGAELRPAGDDEMAVVWLRTDDDQRAQQLLADQEFMAEARLLAEGGIECRLAPACTPRIAVLLVQSGIGLHEMVLRRESLERVYLAQYGAAASEGIR